MGQRLGYRSGFEDEVHSQLKRLGVDALYESDKLAYTVTHQYTPDFKLPNGVYIETKGYFSPSDRGKHLHIRQSNPDVVIAFVFQEPNRRLSKASKTTYSAWCDRHGFPWCSRAQLPSKLEEWLNNEGLRPIPKGHKRRL